MIRKMPVPGLDPGMETGFPKRSCATKMLERKSIRSEAIFALSADLQLRDQAAERRHRAQRHDAAGARVLLRRHVLDRHRKARGVGIDLDMMRVAVERRI